MLTWLLAGSGSMMLEVVPVLDLNIHSEWPFLDLVEEFWGLRWRKGDGRKTTPMERP
jgi:hypothetical protein